MITTQHYNQLTEAESERLEVLAEECSEVIKAVCKIKRHGYASNNNGALAYTNRQDLQMEIGHVFAAVDMLTVRGDVDMDIINGHKYAKRRSIAKWTHHQ